MLCTINSLSELTGIDRRTIGKLVGKLPPIIVEGAIKKWSSDTALRAIYRPDVDNFLDPAQERALLDKERRRQLEMTNAKAEGKLLDVDEVAGEWSRIVAIAKGRLLSIPSRLAPTVVGLGDMRSIEKAIRDEIREALTELSSDVMPEARE